MKWPWQKRDFTRGSADTSSAYVADFFQRLHGFLPDYLDERVLVMDEQEMREFIYKHFDDTLLSYGSQNKARDWPDCDDFAWCARADAIRGAIKEGLVLCPVFGVMEYMTQARGSHALNWAMVMRGARPVILIYEPQSKKWSEDWTDVKRVIGCVF